MNSGASFFANHDRRHNFNFASVFNLGPNLEFSLQWTYGSGNPFTAPTSISEIIVDDGVVTTILFGDRNNARLPDYHRLDVAINLYNDYGWGRQKLTIGAYNVYNRQNPFFVDFVRDPMDSDLFIAESVSIFPLIPNVSYSLSF